MKTVNKPFRKKDAMQLVTGQPVYMDDIIPQDCLIVKLLRSPHANAIVRSINTAVAKKVPGIEAVFTWEDVPQDARRYTQAGQTYPEASPYDRLLIDRHVRFVGDVVAIVAGKDEKCVDKALKLIKVDYEVLEAVLDFHTAKDNPILVHPEDNWESLAPVGADNKRNLCAHDECGNGDIDAVLAGCDVVIDHVYHTKACQQAMMETFRTYCSIDTYGRLNVLSSTQIVFHARRNIANALHIPKSMVRVSKPRIGGGFGAKQTAVSEVYPAFVTWMTKKPSKLIFSRVESQTASSPRHEMEMHVRLGATKDGIVKGIDLYTLSNTGAYGEHGPTTVGLSGHKSIPLYGKAEAFRFVSDVVYTNHMSAGAYRGYGATQGLFAVESAVNELAHKLDPTRKTTMANVFMLETTSPILEIPDVNSYNLYFGWYLGELEQNDEFFDKYHADYPDRCIGFSEYGADANPQYQSSHPEKGDYTESYQCVYHEHIAKMIADRPWLWATHVWNMFDFAADGRDEGGKHGENQKGLVTFDRKLKKDPFYLYKAYWSKEPFVHLCGSRYVDRAEDVTEIKVYSNLPEVSLYKDGQLVETKQGDKVFAFQLPITGKHSIEARSGEHSSVILVNKVDTPNPDYAMDNRKNVTNWFDGELDASCWSVKDNMAKAMADPKAGPILKQISDKAAAARGDVAAAVKDNPALVAMMERAMQRMTIESMLMQAGASEEDIKQLNRVLQGISKE